MTSALRHRMELALDNLHHRLTYLEVTMTTGGGHLDTIEAAQQAGADLHPETLEAIRLAADAKTLRMLAAKLEDVYTKLTTPTD